MLKVTILNRDHEDLNGSVMSWDCGRLDSRRWKLIRNELHWWACTNCNYEHLAAVIEVDGKITHIIYADTEYDDMDDFTIRTYLFEGKNYISEYPEAFDVLTVAV